MAESETPTTPEPHVDAMHSLGGDPPGLELRGGFVLHDGFPVGEYRLATGELVVNLGWARMAGLSVRLQDDPESDNHRGGIAFERPVSRPATR